MAEGKATRTRNRAGELWEDCYERINREFPSVPDAHHWLTDTSTRISDMGLMRLIGDLGNIGNTIKRRGQRTPPSEELVAGTVQTIFRDGLGVGAGPVIERDYTTRPFAEAFRDLVGARSALQMSRRTKIQLDRMKRLLGYRGREYAPTGEEMAAIAAAFGKQPWYFREVRSAMVAAMAYSRMDADPDLSARIVQSIA